MELRQELAASDARVTELRILNGRLIDRLKILAAAREDAGLPELPGGSDFEGSD